MCFRPSALTQDKNAQTGNCPTCGMPVAASGDVTSGVCPYCGDTITQDSSNQFSEIDPSRSTRIL